MPVPDQSSPAPAHNPENCSLPRRSSSLSPACVGACPRAKRCLLLASFDENYRNQRRERDGFFLIFIVFKG